MHNLEITRIRQKKRCIYCGKKARTISQPNDPGSFSRSAEWRIICVPCNKTYVIHEGSMKDILPEYKTDKEVYP